MGNPDSTTLFNKAKIEEIEAKLAKETQDRKNADSTLTTNLNTEIANRKSGDSTLTTNLNTEIADRKSGDSKLQTALDKEIKDRTDADTALTTKLNAEIKARTDADAALQKALDTEIANRKSEIKRVEDYVVAAKTALAKALSDNNVTTASNATFDTITANIPKVRDGNVTAEWVLEGKTFASTSAKRNTAGTMTNYGAQTLPSITVPIDGSTGKGSSESSKTFNGYVTTVSCTASADATTYGTNRYNAGHDAGVTDTKKGNATTGTVLKGYTFTSEKAGVNQTGTMTDLGTSKALPAMAITVDANGNIKGNWSSETWTGYIHGTVSCGTSAVDISAYGNARYNAGFSAGKKSVELIERTISVSAAIGNTGGSAFIWGNNKTGSLSTADQNLYKIAGLKSVNIHTGVTNAELLECKSVTINDTSVTFNLRVHANNENNLTSGSFNAIVCCVPR